MKELTVILIAIVLMAYIFYRVAKDQGEPFPKHAPVTQCPHCNSEIKRLEYGVQLGGDPIDIIVEWHCKNPECQAWGLYGKSEEIPFSESEHPNGLGDLSGELSKPGGELKT